MTGPVPDVAQLLPAARAGSSEALGQALEACRHYLLLIANRELDPELRAKGGASDLVQQTFLEAHQDFARFQGSSEEELLAWLRRLLRNNVSSFTRSYRATKKRRLAREVPLEADTPSGNRPGEPAADTPSPSKRVMEHERAQALQRALDRLPDDYRRVIILRHHEERSFDEIGPLMQRSPEAARKLWSRAIERLQQELEALS